MDSIRIIFLYRHKNNEHYSNECFKHEKRITVTCYQSQMIHKKGTQTTNYKLQRQF
jgi:hypothetical protein